MFIYFLQGATLALSATIMPGPFQAYLLSRTLKNGWKTTLPAALAPLVTDGPIITLVLFVLTQTQQGFLDILRVLGGLFILYLARGIFMNLRKPPRIAEPSDKAASQSLLNAIVLSALNPHPYLFWGVVGGPILLAGWRESPGTGFSFVLGFYSMFVCSLSIFIITFSIAGRISLKINHMLGVLAGVALMVFGSYQIVKGILAVAGMG